MPRRHLSHLVLALAAVFLLTGLGVEDASAATPTNALTHAAAAAGSGVVEAPQRRRKRRKRRKKKKPAPKKKADEPAEPDDGGEGEGAVAPAGPEEGSMAGMRRSNRMEFDARLVRGERPKAGAVYLFQRAPRRLPPLVSLRQSYLKEIVVPVLGTEGMKNQAKKGDGKDSTSSAVKGK